MSYEVLARKYRPKNFNEVVGQDHVIQVLVNSIDSEKIHQAFIFSGTRGVGKTTIARILAKCLNCESDSKPTSEPCNKCSNTVEITSGRSVDFLEIDAASNTQVDKIRDLIETVEYKPAKGRFKIFLIDEVHMLSTASFNALLKTIEEPPSHVVFIFATTNPDKIPKTVQSRCLQLNLKTVSEELIFQHLKKILKSEKIKFDEESIQLIANSANGSVRDSLTILDQMIAFGDGKIEKNQVKKLLGTIDDSILFELIEHVVDGNGKGAFDCLAQIEELSPEYDVILKNIISILHKISIEQVLDNSENEKIKDLSSKTDKEFCQLLYEIAMNAYSRFSVHPNPRESLEICLLRMLAFNPLQKLSSNNQNININNSEKKSPEKINSEVENNLKPIGKELKSKKLIKNNDDWTEFFKSLDLSPFAKNYFGSMSFESSNETTLTLIANSDIGEIPENIMSEFKTTIENKFTKKVDVELKYDEVFDSPIEKETKKRQASQKLAEEDIRENKEINDFINRFGAKIKSDTIKPIKK